MPQVAAKSPIVIHVPSLPSLPRFHLPKFRITPSFNTLIDTVSRAASLAYAEPFTARRPHRERFIEGDLEGRDPDW